MAGCGKEIGNHELGVKNGVARASLFERRLPKSVEIEDVHVHAASGVVAPDALSGTESVVIAHRLGEVAKRRMGPPVVVANEPFFHPHPHPPPLRP